MISLVPQLKLNEFLLDMKFHSMMSQTNYLANSFWLSASSVFKKSINSLNSFTSNHLHLLPCFISCSKKERTCPN